MCNIRFTWYDILKSRLCFLEILIRNPCDSIDLKYKKKLSHTFKWSGPWLVGSWATAEFALSLALLKTSYFHLFCFRLGSAIFPETCQQNWHGEMSRKPNLKPNYTQCKYTQSNLPTTCVNYCSEVKVHKLVTPLLQFIVLGVDFSDHTDQWITDLSFDTKTKTLHI